jgi:hypothetical protein
MTKKIKIVGKQADRVHDTGKTMRRVESAKFASALGAEPCPPEVSRSIDPIALAAIGNELLKRLRSTGGRPALEDANEICKVPLSVEDVAALEKIAESVHEKTGARPSLGQVASVILRVTLDESRGGHAARLRPATPQELADCFFEKSVTLLD